MPLSFYYYLHFKYLFKGTVCMYLKNKRNFDNTTHFLLSNPSGNSDELPLNWRWQTYTHPSGADVCNEQICTNCLHLAGFPARAETIPKTHRLILANLQVSIPKIGFVGIGEGMERRLITKPVTYYRGPG